MHIPSQFLLTSGYIFSVRNRANEWINDHKCESTIKRSSECTHLWTVPSFFLILDFKILTWRRRRQLNDDDVTGTKNYLSRCENVEEVAPESNDWAWLHRSCTHKSPIRNIPNEMNWGDISWNFFKWTIPGVFFDSFRSLQTNNYFL